MDKGHFEKLRFWGKIFGTQKNYYVAEAEQNAEEEADDDEGNEEATEAEDAKEDDDEEGEGEEDPLPKSTYKPPPTVPKEERGTGVNKYTYYVCNYRKLTLIVRPWKCSHPSFPAGAPWVKLPIALPAHIAQARQIKFFFTGDLNKPIHAFPAYPGTEKNYLRAQIARISATTHVSPAGKFKFSDVSTRRSFGEAMDHAFARFRKKKKGEVKKKVDMKTIRTTKTSKEQLYLN